jgi:hypothetical protein
MHALSLPYYTGFTSHVAGRVPAALLQTVASLSTVWSRLSVNKPPFVGAGLLVFLWLGYLFATAGTALFMVLRFWKSDDPQPTAGYA